MTRRAVLQSAPATAAALAAACAHDAIYRTVDVRPAHDGVVHVGNSTHLVMLGGVHVLTDPWVKDPADTITQHTVPPAPLPVDVDVVLVTHEHEDHFDTAALALVKKSATLIVPAWLEQRAKALGFASVRAVKPGDSFDVAGIKVDVVLGKHQVDEVVYRFSREGKRVLFAGDTLPTNELFALAKEPVDLAILPADGGAFMGERAVMNVREATEMGVRFGVDQPGRGALLTHHEFELTSPVWRVIADVQPVDTSKLPAWFKAPKPGDTLAFPWMAA